MSTVASNLEQLYKAIIRKVSTLREALSASFLLKKYLIIFNNSLANRLSLKSYKKISKFDIKMPKSENRIDLAIVSVIIQLRTI